jgi:hypothetical protein
MLNIHLNGDMVRCPDIRAIHYRLMEQRLAQARCKYGFEEIKCPAWYQYCKQDEDIRPLSSYGRCILSGCDQCPMRLERKINGLKTKTFQIDNVKYRKLSSAAHFLVKASDYKTLFLTLTFSHFKKYCNDKQVNKLFSNFVKKLREDHDCQGYIAVREYGAKRGRVHFHILASIKFIPFAVLNRLWCDSISEYCSFSPNAVTSDPKTRFIKNPVRAMRYVCKYFSKCKGQRSESRLIFMSNNVNIKHKAFDNTIGEFYTVNNLLEKYKSIKAVQTSDYTTAFRICDNKEFDQFCNDYLYKLFNLSDRDHELYTYWPDNTG